MNQTNTTRSIMFAVIAIGLVFSVSGLVVGHMVPTVYVQFIHPHK